MHCLLTEMSRTWRTPKLPSHLAVQVSGSGGFMIHLAVLRRGQKLKLENLLAVIYQHL